MIRQVQAIVFEGKTDFRPDDHTKLSENAKPLLVSLGCMMGGVACPSFVLKRRDYLLDYTRRTIPDLSDAPLEPKSPLDPQALAIRMPVSAPTMEDLHRGRAFSFARFISKHFPRAQTISLSPANSNLLNLHYYHSEMQFSMTLVDIGSRLREIPREARCKFCLFCTPPNILNGLSQ